MPEPDLHTRLRSAIEERLALAQAATEGPWIADAIDEDPDDWTVRTESRWYVDEDGHRCYGRQFITEDGRGLNAVDSAHIAANDPAFAIRACRADLARLHRHAAKGWSAEQVAKTPAVADERWCESCNYTAWPCPEVRSLASVWLEVE